MLRPPAFSWPILVATFREGGREPWVLSNTNVQLMRNGKKSATTKVPIMNYSKIPRPVKQQQQNQREQRRTRGLIVVHNGEPTHSAGGAKRLLYD